MICLRMTKLLQSLTLVEGEINELEQGNKPNTQNEIGRAHV